MKKVLLITFFFAFSMIYAQEVKPTYEKVGEKVKATYYYEDGSVYRQGFFKNKKLTGKWTEFDKTGNTVSIAYYKKGKKTGNWLQWKDGKFRQISYDNNNIVAVGKWTDSNTRVASN